MIISQAEYIQLASAMIQGICSNPTSGDIKNDSYGQGLIVTSVFINLGQALSGQGIQIEARPLEGAE